MNIRLRIVARRLDVSYKRHGEDHWLEFKNFKVNVLTLIISAWFSDRGVPDEHTARE